MGEWFDTYLDRARLRFVGVAVLAIGLMTLVVSFGTSDRGRTVFGPPLGADFAGFYAAGAILNSPHPDRLYDLDYHNQTYHEILPNLDASERLAFRYPPFVAVAFRPLARLPYEAAFACWLVFSAGAYLAGLALLWKSRTNLPATEMPMVLLLALSFEPFLIECWLGGQVSAFAFLLAALAFRCRERGQPFVGGLALGLLAYKPTLLALLGPMLLVGRCGRMLAGLTVALLGLGGFSYLTAGPQVCWDSLEGMVSFLLAKTTRAEEIQAAQVVAVPWTKYVDLNAFLRLLPNLPLAAKAVLALAVAGTALWSLLPAWWRLERRGDLHRRLTWAATVIWTLVLNIYIGIYDVTLAVFAALVTADLAWRQTDGKSGELPRGLRVVLVLLYLVPWFTQPLAKATGVQAMTLVLLGMGSYLGRNRDREGAFRATSRGRGLSDAHFTSTH